MIEKGDVEVTQCPTKQIWSDFLDKPKQGKFFREDSSLLMKLLVDYKYREDWEDIDITLGVTNPEVVPSSTIENKKNGGSTTN